MALKNTRTRVAVINALCVGALLTTGCPNNTGATMSPISLNGGANKARNKAAQPGGNPGANQPAAPTLPVGEPVGPVPQLPVLPTLPVTEETGAVATKSFLSGLVAAPSTIISNNGGAIISNNGSSIISNNGGAIIGNNGGGLISNNGGSIIANNGGTYRVLQAAGAEGAIKNAYLYLTDRDERFFRNTKTSQVFATTTDANGNYRFNIEENSGFPLNKDVVVNALVNGNLRLSGYVSPIDGENEIKLNLATTVATELLRGEAYRAGKSLKDFDRTRFYQTVSLTQQAMNAGDIVAVKTVTDHTGTSGPVGTFDLRIDKVYNLRNQYIIAISAVENKANAALKAISDNWKAIFGFRPTAVTTLIGNGKFPQVFPAFNSGFTNGAGGVEGDHRFGTAVPPTQLATGFTYGVAVAERGDVFVAGYSETANSGFIRWLKTDGSVQSIWLPTYTLVGPGGICVENQPGTGAPGTLLVVDNYSNLVMRVPIVDTPIVYHDGDGYAYETHKMEIVAGENEPVYSESTDPYHPNFVDCMRTDDVDKNPIDKDGAAILPYMPYSAEFGGNAHLKVPKYNVKVDATEMLEGRWRLADEGDRKYIDGNVDTADGAESLYEQVDYLGNTAFQLLAPGDAVPKAARYAHLNQPQDVEVDELGNIYIADRANHRVRMIPKVTGSYFGYRQPTGQNVDGTLIISGSPTQMKAGSIYTIVGNPRWDPSSASLVGGYWVGEYDNGGGVGQAARLDQPYSLAFDKTRKVLYIADYDNQLIREVSRATGAISTVAGNIDGLSQRGSLDRDYAPADLSEGKTGGDGGLATQARLSFPRGITLDKQGRLYIADNDSGRIRMVGLDKTITTIAGRKHDATAPRLTDNVTDGDALNWVDLYDTQFLDVDLNGNVLLSDNRHRRVRKLWRQWE